MEADLLGWVEAGRGKLNFLGDDEKISGLKRRRARRVSVN